jgi:nitrous oxidase accessory protein NosD
MPNIMRNNRHGTIHNRHSLLLTGLTLLLWCGGASIASAANLCVNPGGKSGCKATISAAVAAASAGDTITVASGTYKEEVTITKSISLVAQGNAEPTINATGLPNGIFINGMSAAPNLGLANVLISGFRIENANFEGILVANAYDVVIADNDVVNNNRSLDIADATCPGAPAFETNEGEDCGEGIHLMGTVHASVIRNEIAYNSGGILISDETGPSEDNLISENRVHDNPYDCGITLASHGPATNVIPTATLSYGVVRNTIAHNVASHNGYDVPGAGAGVGIFAPFPGTTAAGNVVINNDLIDNGLPGVTMHNHAAAPSPAPPVNLNDNVIVGNRFSGNGADTDDAATSAPTGVNLFSLVPVTGTVISQNVFDGEAIDVAFNAPAGQVSAHFNNFDAKTIAVDNLGTGTVNATDNWWHCPKGPGAASCSKTSGSNINVSPWLTTPFQAEFQ